MEKINENKNIIILENGTSLILEEEQHEILSDILKTNKNIKIYKANEIEIKEKEEKKNKKHITIFLQNGIELDLEDPTDEMISEIISKCDNAIIVEKTPSNSTSITFNKPKESKEFDDVFGFFTETASNNLLSNAVNTSNYSNVHDELADLFDFSKKTVLETTKVEKKITKEEVRKALLKPGTPINGQVLPPFTLFTLYHTLKE